MISLLAVHPGWVTPDYAFGDRRCASLLNCLAAKASVDLFQVGVHDPTSNTQRIQALRELYRGALVPDGGFGLRRCILSRRYEVVLIEYWRCAESTLASIRRHLPWAVIIVDTVDVHFIREAAAAELGLMDWDQVKQNRERELQVYRTADAIIVVTPEDRVALVDAGINVPIFIIPNIVPLRERLERRREADVLFVGGFQHAPNVDGILWFAKECWPEVRRQVPHAKLLVVGSKAPPEVLSLASTPGIEVPGYVPQTLPFLDRAAVSIAPLRYGGGMKGKVCEALAAGIPLVTTSVGATGIPLKHEVDALIADQPEAFANCVARCIKELDWAGQMGRQGQAVIERLCTEPAVISQIETIINELKRPSASVVELSRWTLESTVLKTLTSAYRGFEAAGGRHFKGVLRRDLQSQFRRQLTISMCKSFVPRQLPIAE